MDDISDRMNASVRNAHRFKVPDMHVIGESEMEDSRVALRRRIGESLPTISVDAFLKLALRKIDVKI